MATPREIFEKDFKDLRVHTTHRIEDQQSGEAAEIIAAISFDFEAGVRYASIFIGDTALAVNAITHYLDHPDEVLKVGARNRDGFRIPWDR